MRREGGAAHYEGEGKFQPRSSHLSTYARQHHTMRGLSACLLLTLASHATGQASVSPMSVLPERRPHPPACCTSQAESAPRKPTTFLFNAPRPCASPNGLPQTVVASHLPFALIQLGQLPAAGLFTQGAVTQLGGADVIQFQLTQNRGVRITATIVGAAAPGSLFGGVTNTPPTGAPPVFSQP